MDMIGCFMVEGLNTVTARVATDSGKIPRTANNPLFLLCFVLGNE